MFQVIGSFGLFLVGDTLCEHRERSVDDILLFSSPAYNPPRIAMKTSSDALNSIAHVSLTAHTSLINGFNAMLDDKSDFVCFDL